MEELVGRRYAQALFEVAVETEKLEEFKDEIIVVSQAFQNEPRLNTIIQHPKVNRKEKKEIIDAIFKGRVSDEILNLLYIIIDKERERNIKDISDEYIDLFNEKFGIVDAKAITAIPMSEDERLELEQKLSKKLDKKVNLENEIDKDIIGGVLIKIKDKVIDQSIRRQLDMLEKSLQSLRVTKKEVESK